MDNIENNSINILMDKLNSIERDIFEYSINNISNNVVNIFSYIIEKNIISGSDTARLASLNMVMSDCLNAMQSCDYLLLADTLKYRLKPVLGGTN